MREVDIGQLQLVFEEDIGNEHWQNNEQPLNKRQDDERDNLADDECASVHRGEDHLDDAVFLLLCCAGEHLVAKEANEEVEQHQEKPR